MNPAVLAALIGGGLPFLGGLFQRGDPTGRLNALIAALMSPEAIAGRANQYQKAWYESPAFTHTQSAALSAGRQAEAAVGRAGAGVTSGMDVLRSGAAAGLGTGLISRASADAWLKNLDLAQNAAFAHAGGIRPEPNYSHELFGAGLNFFGPIFTKWLSKKYGWDTPTQPAR